MKNKAVAAYYKDDSLIAIIDDELESNTERLAVSQVLKSISTELRDSSYNTNNNYINLAQQQNTTRMGDAIQTEDMLVTSSIVIESLA